MSATTLQYAHVPAAEDLLELNAKVFDVNFNRRPFLLTHHLTGHPLFTLPRLIALTRRLAPQNIEYNAGNVPLSLDPQATPRTGLSVQETLMQMHAHNSWVVLKNVEQDLEYRALLERCLDQIQARSERLDPRMCCREGFIFISSPGAVTPYHLDPEHNFLLQIHGRKTVHMFDAKDRSLLSERELEERAAGGHRNLVFREAYQSKAAVFELTPGHALHFPVTAPHWVKNGTEVSISFSITFRTAASLRERAIREMNHRLRKWGLSPQPPGRSVWRDTLKYQGMRVCRRAQRYWPAAKK